MNHLESLRARLSLAKEAQEAAHYEQLIGRYEQAMTAAEGSLVWLSHGYTISIIPASGLPGAYTVYLYTPEHTGSRQGIAVRLYVPWKHLLETAREQGFLVEGDGKVGWEIKKDV